MEVFTAAVVRAAPVVFPQPFVSAYPKGPDSGARIGWRIPDGGAPFRRHLERAIEVSGPTTGAVGRVSRSAGAHPVIGEIARGKDDAGRKRPLRAAGRSALVRQRTPGAGGRRGEIVGPARPGRRLIPVPLRR